MRLITANVLDVVGAPVRVVHPPVVPRSAYRAGYEHKIGFEGGQMPIQRRVPKFGFKNPTRIEYKAVNVAAIRALAEQLGKAEIGLEDIKAAGLADAKELVKVLGNGEISTAVTVTADAFSASAVSKIEAAGGKTIVIGK